MATSAYHAWVARGRPWTEAKPIAELEAYFLRNGVPVLGTIGNEEHLQAKTPEDHTPFSFTWFPVPLPGDIVTAIDVRDVNLLGRKILVLARAGKCPWLKYINFENKNYNQRDGFQASKWNADTHVHMSIRTDWLNGSIGGFDPLGVGDMELIKAIQTALRDAGFDPGPVDGLWGPRTQGAFTAALRPTPGPKGDPGAPGEPGKVPTMVTFGPVTATVTAVQ